MSVEVAGSLRERECDVVRVLFVCLGNVCRSPSAEGVLRGLVAAAGLAHRIEVDSAGTGGHFAGQSPDPRARAAAGRRGLDLSGQRARQVSVDDFARFHHVVAMDASNLVELEVLQARAGGRAQLSLFMDHAPDVPAGGSVPDPFYGGAQGFEHMLDLLEDGAAGLLESIR